jgi:DNA (cytosine-5)-methyltransferase 1
MLNSVDLFSGIGGFAMALRDIAKPLLYCDSAPHVRAHLHSMACDGRLPDAPIVNDVRDIDAILSYVGSRHVHVVTGGFPCIGFSHAGGRKGLDNGASSLFHDMMKVVRILKPDIVFMENVVEVLTANEGRDYKTILSEFSRCGYTIRWTTVSAVYVGAPHTRNRWFCMCIRNNARLSVLTYKNNQVGSWKTKFPSPIVRKSPENRVRITMLGNALVPAAARLAFARLYSGFEIKTLTDLESKSIIAWNNMVAGKMVSAIPRHGGSHGTAFIAASLPRVVPRTMRITLDPKHYSTNQEYQKNSLRVPSPLVKKPITKSLFPTPRASLATHGHVLSERTVRDLPTFVMYMSNMEGHRFTKTCDKDSINPKFVEWLMGFPPGHTELR